MNNSRRRFVVGAMLAILVCIALRTYREFVPWGASPVPFVSASVSGGLLISPGGEEFDVVFNDAGAAHSGNHWTWIVSHHPLFGRYVVAEGYLRSEHIVGAAPVPVEWSGKAPIVDFLPSRYTAP